MRIVIIGAGQAGAQGAVTLRQKGFGGAVTMIGAEDHLPYQRPPLSKAYLKGEMAADRLHLRPADFYEAQGVTLALGDPAASIDLAAREVRTEGGATHAYDRLLIATGAPARRVALPGSQLPQVHTLRTLSDSDTLRALLTADGPACIVGGGYIGLEVAAVLRGAGKAVTVIEAADRVLARVASPPVSAFFEALHVGRGVDLRLGSQAESIEGDGSVAALTLSDGERVACGAVLLAVGARPETALAEAAGLSVEDGILVDEHTRTSDPNVFAAGDCTRFPDLRTGERVRLESVPNAIEQAKVAAVNMAGGEAVHDALPWFWSDQYEVKLQAAGLPHGADRLVERRQDAYAFSVWAMRGDVPIAVEAVNDPAAFALGKRLIPRDAAVDAAALGDPGVPLKELL